MKERNSLMVLVVLYAVGLIAMYIPDLKPWFLPLTPLNLLISFLILMDSYRWEKGIMGLSFKIFLIGMSAEWIGIHSGWLFGDYHYVANLGPKLWGVPLIIGVNWAMLTILSFAIVSVITKNKIYRILIGAVLMTAIDFIMEPVAIRHQFWLWNSGQIPLFNYVSWFSVALLTLLGAAKQEKVLLNNTAIALFILINLFFLVQLFV